MEKILRLSLLVILISVMGKIGWGQTTVFSDDFNSDQSTIWTTSGQIGSSSWYVNRSGDDWGARRNTSDILELTNDTDTTANVNGWVFVYVNTSDFLSPYSTTLSSNPDLITWYFNLRQSRTDPAGFGSGNYGIAFILAGSATTAQTTGNGYAIALGQSGETDPIRLVKYTNGLSNSLTNIITSNTEGLSDFGIQYISLKVTYDPATNRWELFLRNDGTTSFALPNTGILISQGSAVDGTYTSVALDYMGGYWQGATAANQTAFFDNVSVTVVPAGGPTITVSPLSLSGFSYVKYSGPSAEKSFTVNGSNLTADITITPPTNYEISTGTGGSFSAMNPITLIQTGGTVSETLIYVRLKAGLEDENYDEDITVTSTDATKKIITCSGIVLPNAWINEIHYDNIGTDTLEGFEVVIESAGKYSMSDFSIDLYNGENGTVYGTNKLSTFIIGSSQNNFTLYYKMISNIQNDCEGIALGYQGNLIQFLSYEGTFTATDGPATGIISIDIGVEETLSTILLQSLQLIGNGTKYSDFTWVANLEQTWGLPNNDGETDQSLPISLESFTGMLTEDGVVLIWTTASELENQGFNIYRKLLSDEYYLLAGFLNNPALKGFGSTSERHTYHYTDKSAQPGATYAYLLSDVNYAGLEKRHYDHEVTVTIPEVAPAIAGKFKLEPIYPNPFNQSFTIPITLPESQLVEIILYDCRGQVAQSLDNRTLPAGAYKLNYTVNDLSSGIYFIKIAAGTNCIMRKVALMK